MRHKANIEVQLDYDGNVWIHVKSSKGTCGSLNATAAVSSPLARRAFDEWADDALKNANDQTTTRQ